MPLGPDRFPPLSDDVLTPEQKAAAAAIAATPRGGVIGPFVPLLRSPELMDCVQRTGAYLRYRSAIGTRLSELAILLVARYWDQQVEWAIHAPIAEQAGISPAVIEAIRTGAQPAYPQEDEAAVHAVCTEMQQTRQLADPTFANAMRLFGDQGVIDLLGLIGYYSLLATVMNGARTATPASAAAPLVER